MFQVEPTLKQPVTLQVSLPSENLALIARVDVEVLEMMLLLLKSLGMVAVAVSVAVAVVPTVMLKVYRDLPPVEDSVVLQVTLRASLRLLVLVVLVGHPVDLRAVPRHRLIRLVTVVAAVLTASHRLDHLAGQVVPDLLASRKRHPTAT